MDEETVFAETAEAVAQQAIAEGLARRPLPPGAVADRAARDIAASRASLAALCDAGLIAPPPPELADRAWAKAVTASEG